MPKRSIEKIKQEKITWENLPDILTPKDIWDFLPIGRNGVYDLLEAKRIPSVRVGQKIIVTKAALREFLGGAVE